MVSTTAKSLLDIPGEVRNRIYEVARKGFAPTVTLRSPFLDYSDEDDVPPNPYVSRPFLGLTQTCRQIRTEFLPIYFRTLDVCLDYSDVYDYLAAFIWQGQLNEGPKFDEFNICLSNDIQTLYGHTENTYERMNIAPLLRLYKTMPDFDLGFIDNHDFHTSLILKKVMNRNNEVWWDYMFKAVSRIHLSDDRHSWTDLHFLIKRKERDWWMKYSDGESSSHVLVSGERMEWGKTLGLTSKSPWDVTSVFHWEVGLDKGMNSDEGQWLERFF
ncbi:hypothetical protein FB567DRAFT_176069 [Paraphoma chrysanthemicola]|uniref:F-box domain-containing protein n=1 Tax=Paraphoma chrysanthemicola TaxID=798071 RepID=A0A8K0W2W8_9PLEO|nr:hypothetical protein FB567DRAFT_176069 [Paraphoma chrysanthemicola]